MRISKKVARLDGIALDALDKRIFLLDVRESAPKMKLTTSALPMGGFRLTRRERQSRSVVLRFVIWEKGAEERARVLRKVSEWAEGGGYLSIYTRDAQRLKVVCEKLPELSGKAWDGEMELGLISYAPDWESEDEIYSSALIGAGVEREFLFRTDGTAQETPLGVEITSEGGVLHSVNVWAGDQQISLSGLALATGQKLVIAEEDGILRMTAAGESVLDKRSAQSADSILLKQREGNRVRVRTDAAARVILRARARWI